MGLLYTQLDTVLMVYILVEKLKNKTNRSNSYWSQRTDSPREWSENPVSFHQKPLFIF